MDKLTDLKRKIDNKQYILSYYPQNLRDIIGDKKKVVFRGKNLKTSYLIDIVHTLIKKSYQTEKELFNLSAYILRQKYGTFYNYYMEYLKRKQIIRMVSDYFVGKKSKTYKLREESLNDVENYRNYDNFLIKKYKKFYAITKLSEMNYKYMSLETMLKVVKYLGSVEIKYQDAVEYLDEIKLTKKKHLKNLNDLESFYNKSIWYHFDRYGRFHSNLTTIKSEIRNRFLLIDGEPSVEIDITNSQPMFLTSLMSKYIDNVDNEEYEFFKQLVIKGELYNYVASQTEIKERKQLKKMIYVVLFGTNHLNKKENKAFNKLFPSVFQFIRWYKKNMNSHRAMSHELQRSESNLLFNNIIEELISKYPDMPFFTVHDSICIKNSDHRKVKRIFDKHVRRIHKEL